MKKFIKSIFNFFGFTVVTNADYNDLVWGQNHYKGAYDSLVKSNAEFHDFVTNEIMPGWTKSDERCKELINQMSQCVANWEKAIELNDRCIAYLKSIDTDTANELKQDSWEINKRIKENYRHQLADMGIAIDRLMGELMSAHGYTEKEIKECLDSSLYNQIQQYLPPFDWKYSE